MWSSPEDKKAQWKPRPRTFVLGRSGLCSLCTSPYIGLLLLPMLAFLPPFFILGITATKCHNLSTPGPFRDLYFPYFGPNFQKKKSDRLSSFMRARLQMSVAAIVEPVDWQLQIARPLQSSLSNWARVWAGDASGSQGLAFCSWSVLWRLWAIQTMKPSMIKKKKKKSCYAYHMKYN